MSDMSDNPHDLRALNGPSLMLTKAVICDPETGEIVPFVHLLQGRGPLVANVADVVLKPAHFGGEDRELLERVEKKLDALSTAVLEMAKAMIARGSL